MLVAPAWLASCGEDRWAGYAEQTKTDRWIDDTMRVWYYWREDIPGTNDLNYFTDPITFFRSLLSSDDGKNGTPYSTIDTLEAVTRSIPYTDHSYGFQFTTNRVEGNDTALYAHVLYVAQGSPAADIGLERGDWIMQMDGHPITQDNYARLYGDGAMNLTVGYYDPAGDTILAYAGTRQMAQARAVDDNPVHYRNIYERNGKRIGYLVYNHFSSGSTLEGGGTEYDDDLRAASRYFASGGVNEFVLDLRYNNGGQLSCAQLLCTLLAPASALGQTLGYVEYNSRFNPRQATLSLDENIIGSGANLNLGTLYILTSAQTASASEMLINCLKPYMNVILIGGTMFVMWLGERITDRGIGNGISLIIMVGIIARLPYALTAEIGEKVNSTTGGLLLLVVELIILFFVFVAAIALVQATRRVPIQYAKRIIGNRQYVGGQRNFIPLKINAAGVMPIIFAQAIMLFPLIFGKFDATRGLAATLSNYTGFWYNLIFFFLVVVFTYFYTAVTVNPTMMAEELKKSGGFIPGVKPGKKTVEYLDSIMSRVTLPGSFFLGLIAILPAFAMLCGVNNQFASFFGGTSLLILVGVVLDTLQQIESHLLMRHYDGLMKTGRLKGRSGM